MGFSPAQVDAMTAWEFMCCTVGFSEAHGGKSREGGSEELSDADLRAMGIQGF